MPIDRRNFIAATATGLAAGCVSLPTRTPKISIALSQYSLRALIHDGSLKAIDFPDFTASTFGIQAIDLWEGGLPKERLDDAHYLANLRSRADKAGTDLFLLMTGALEAAENKRAASLQKLLPSINRASLLGCDYLRVFLKAPDGPEEAVVSSSVEALKPLADAAAARGVMIVIEPGASKHSKRGAFLAKVATALNHPACKLMPDFGKLENNVYDGTQAMLPHTVTISAKMHSFDATGNQPHFDYDRLMKMITKANYAGYLAIEWEGSKLKPIPGIKASQALIARALMQA